MIMRAMSIDSNENNERSVHLARLVHIMNMPSASVKTKRKHTWNPQDSSSNIRVQRCATTIERRSAYQSTDCIRGKVGYTSGIHVWLISWSRKERGTHPVIGVATGKALLHATGYQCLVGSDCESWGWDILRNQLLHDVKHGESGPVYPSNLPLGATFVVPSFFHMVLDMDEGLLSFIIDGYHLGVAFDQLKGKELYPIVNTVFGYCKVSLSYIGGLDAGPFALKDICRLVIRQQVGTSRLDFIDSHLNLPNALKRYLRYHNFARMQLLEEQMAKQKLFIASSEIKSSGKSRFWILIERGCIFSFVFPFISLVSITAWIFSL